MPKPLVVGLIGGIASGKSTVARMLQAHGGLWLDSDRMAHEVLQSPEVRTLLRERFGEAVFQTSGSVDRKAIATHVFGLDEQSRQNLHWLEQIIHPRVRQLTEQRIAQEGQQYPFVIIDAPLLLEAGWAPVCDRIVFVDTPQQRRQTLAAERGWSAEELARREAAQMSLELKREQSSDQFDNSGSLETLGEQVERFVRSLAPVND